MDISEARCPSCRREMQISRAWCSDCEVALDGDFEVSALARLPIEDQLFVAAFLRHHGSIKKMERLFSISYPTVKNRLRAISAQLDRSFEAPSAEMDILERVERGELSVDEAIERLE